MQGCVAFFEKETYKCTPVLQYPTSVNGPLKNNLKDRGYDITEPLKNERFDLIRSSRLVGCGLGPSII